MLSGVSPAGAGRTKSKHLAFTPLINLMCLAMCFDFGRRILIGCLPFAQHDIFGVMCDQV